MTWDTMLHDKAKFKSIIIDADTKKPVGFILSGMTYDGDGNEQWESGTDMEIMMRNEKAFLELIIVLNSIKEKLMVKK